MVKKITAIIMLVIFAAAVNANENMQENIQQYDMNITVYHYYKRSVVRALIFAVFSQNQDALWNLQDPDFSQRAQSNGFTREILAESLFKKINIDTFAGKMNFPKEKVIDFVNAVYFSNADTIWSLMTRDEQKKAAKDAGSEKAAKEKIEKNIPQMQENMIKFFDNYLVKNNDKWYLYDKEISEPYNKVNETEQTVQNVTQTVNITVYHHNKNSVVRAFVYAVFHKNVELLWNLQDQELSRKAEENGLTKELFAEAVFKKVNIDGFAKEMGIKKEETADFTTAVYFKNIDKIWSMMDKDKQQQAIKAAGNEEKAKKNIEEKIPQLQEKMAVFFNSILVFNNDKWYIYDREISDPYIYAVRHGNQKEAAESLCRAIAQGDVEILWKLICKADKDALIKEFGDEEKAKAELAKDLKPNEAVRKLLDDSSKRESFISGMEANISSKYAWVRVDGKIYIDLKKLNRLYN